MARRTAVVLAPVIVVALAFFVFSARPDAGPVVTADAIGAFGFRAGELVSDFAYEDVHGDEGTLSGLLAGHEAVVIMLRTTECPVAMRYGHRLARLEKEYGAKGVAFAYLNVSPQDTPEKIREELETFGLAGTYIVDPEGGIGATLQAEVSTEVFVIDKAHTLRYRGAIDDQYGIDFAKPEPRETYLRDALNALLAGEDVQVKETVASGCFLETDVTEIAARDLTYHNRISRIVNENCVTCHRDGGVAPMRLDSYQQVYGFREMIRFMTSERRMPPWFASPEHGEWANDRSLSERDLRDLHAWIEAGAPEGDPAMAPIPRKFAGGWQLSREPDVIVQIPEPMPVPAEGVLDYQYVYVKTDFDRDLWIKELELKPTAPMVTHHIIVYQEGPDDERRGPWLIGYAPGSMPPDFPENAGKKIEKGSWLMFELHYTTNGRPASDQAMMGLVLTDEEPEQEVMMDFVATTDFEIPAHAANHEVVAEKTWRRPGTLYELLPHMHLRGKAFRYELIRADGTGSVLLEVPRYDFNWQLSYRFEDPLRMEVGDKIRATAWYDNSEANPANPDPTQSVHYGEQSFEEMMFGFYQWIPDRTTRSATDSDSQQ